MGMEVADERDLDIVSVATGERKIFCVTRWVRGTYAISKWCPKYK
jgi:hypothetical protein